MKIVHVISGLGLGGAEMMLYRLIQSSQQDGVQHTVVSLSSLDVMGDRIRELGVEVRMLGMSRAVPNLFLMIRLIGWLVEISPDVVQTWMYHADLFGGIAAYIARVVLTWKNRSTHRLGLVWCIRQTDFPSFWIRRKLGAIAKCCALLSSRMPDLIVCCANASRLTHIRGGYCAQRMKVIPNGFDLDLFRPGLHRRTVLRGLLGLDADTRIVGIVGRFHPAKDYENFVAAIARVSLYLPDCHYVMIGKDLDTRNAQLLSLIEGAGVSSVCHLLGPRDDLHLLIPGFDLFCLSSRSEGFPNVVGEAMACGVPCVATDVGDTALLLGDAGHLVPRENSAALAAGLLLLLRQTPERRRHLGALARQRIQAQFSIDASWRQYKHAYAEAKQRVRQ